MMQFLLMSAAIALLLAGCNKPPSPEQKWLLAQRNYCDAMRSNLTYDQDAKTVYCYRTPLMRMPKLMFSATYKVAQ